VDALVGLLDGPRARGAFLLRSLMRPPWALRVQDLAPLTVVALVRGGAVVMHEDSAARQLTSGDLAVVRGPRSYVVADDPATPVQVVIHPGQRCTTPDGVELSQAMDLGVRTWGNDRDGTTALLTGTYQMDTALGRRLLGSLPEVLVLPGEAMSSPLVGLLADEIVKDEPGQAAVLDRLLDLLLIATLRAWFARADAAAPAWYRALGDPVVGRALRMLHNNPAHDWSVSALADATGVSRATLARRFTELVGEPPMAFLTDWRLTLAADLLREPDATVGAVARQVGYGSPYALSAAFKRVFGVSPQQHRLATSA
jgi:AraC-like DNA-binding protein